MHLKQMHYRADEQAPAQAGQGHARDEQDPVPQTHAMLTRRSHENGAGHAVKPERSSQEEERCSKILANRLPHPRQKLV